MDGYDLVAMICCYKKYSTSKLKVNDIELLYSDRGRIDITLLR